MGNSVYRVTCTNFTNIPFIVTGAANTFDRVSSHFAQLSVIYAAALVFGETTTGTLTACVIGSVAMFFCCLLEVPVINWAAQ